MDAEKQRTILLVDDEAIIAMSEKTALEQYGYNVITALSGEEAIETIEKTPAIDLILMDINLGKGMDGTEAAAIILRQRDMPVVFLSSHMEPEVVAKTEKITSYGYVVKDSSITVLDASIKMAFKLFAAKLKEKEKAAELRENEQLLNFHVNNSPLATIEFSSDFIVKRWSGEAEKLFGWNQSETMGKPLMDLKMIYDEDIPLVEKIMERLSHGSSQHIVSTNRNYTKAGKVIICEWYNSVLLDPQGKMVSLMSRGIDITERKQAEAMLRGSEERYRALFDRSLDLIYIHDFEGRFIDANDAALNRLGYTREEIRGLNFASLLSEDQLPLALKTLREIQETGFQKDLTEFRLRHKNGSEVHVETQGSAILSKGSFSAIQAIARDISERKRASAALRESEARFKAQYQGMPVPTFTWQKQGDDFTLIDYNDAAKDITHEKVIELMGSKASDLYANRQDILRDLKQCFAERKVIKRETLSEHFMPCKLIALTIVFIPADLVMVHIEDISERKRAESQKEAATKALQISLEKYRVLFESFPLGITISDDSGKIIEANIQSEKLLGIPRDGQTQKRIDGKEWRIIRTDGTPMPAGEFASVRASQEKRLIENVEMGIVKDKGEITWINVTAAPIPLEGYGVAITYNDISERKQAESQREAALEALRESEKEQRSLLKSMINAFVLFESIFDEGGNFISYRFLYINEAYERITGVKNEEVKGKSVHEVWPETEAEWVRRYGEVAVTGVSSEFELYHDPTKKLYHCNVYRPWNENRRFCVIFEDITERKRAESQREAALEALHKSEEFSKRVIESSNDCIKVMDMEGNLLSMNKGGQKLLEIDDVTPYLHRSWIDFWKGSDKDAALEAISKAKQGDTGKFYGCCETTKGTPKWFECIITPIKDSHGNIDRLLSISRDISERKQAEDEIKRQLTEKEVLLKEVHHRIKNNIAAIGGLISLRMQSIANPEALAVLKDANSRVTGMRLLYDRLLLDEGYKDISVKNYLGDLIDTIVALFPEQAKIKLDRQIADFHLDAKQLFPLGSIINELLTNTMKYAFIDRKTGLIKISLAKVGNHVALTIEDDGNKLPAGFDINKTKGFGLTLVKMLSQQLGGSFSMEKRAGTRCKVEFDI